MTDDRHRLASTLLSWKWHKTLFLFFIFFWREAGKFSGCWGQNGLIHVDNGQPGDGSHPVLPRWHLGDLFSHRPSGWTTSPTASTSKSLHRSSRVEEPEQCQAFVAIPPPLFSFLTFFFLLSESIITPCSPERYLPLNSQWAERSVSSFLWREEGSIVRAEGDTMAGGRRFSQW